MSRHGQYAEGNSKFQLVMPEALLARIKDRAGDEEVSASEVVRRSCELYLAVPLRKRRR